MAAILKFKMAASTDGASVIVTGQIRFLDPENMGLTIDFKPLRV